MKLSHALLLLFAVVFVGGGGVYLLSRMSPPEPDDAADGGSPQSLLSDPAAAGEGVLRVAAQGRLEPRSGVVNLSVLPGEKVTQIKAGEGDRVASGDVLVVLESKALYEAELAVAQQRLQAAELQFAVEQELAAARRESALLALRQAELQQREIAEKSRDIALGERQAEQARRELDRLSKLARDERTSEFISEQQVERQSLLQAQAAHEVESGRFSLELAAEGGQLGVAAAENGVRLAELAGQQLQAADPREALRLAVDAARLRVEKSDVRSPLDGQVLRVMIREGERAANAPVLQVADLGEMICVAEVYDSMRQYLRVGDPVRITTPATPRVFSGAVESVGAIVGDPDFPNPNPLARQDRHTVQVKIKLDESSQEAAREFVHLLVNVEILASGAAGEQPK